MKFSQTFLLLALGLIVSLPQEVKSNRGGFLGGGGGGLLGGGGGGLLGGGGGGLLGGGGGGHLGGGGAGLFGGGGAGGPLLGGGGVIGGGGLFGGGSSSQQQGGWSSSSGGGPGGFMGAGGWSSSSGGGPGGFMGTGGSGGGSWSGGGATGGGAPGGGAAGHAIQGGGFLGGAILGELPGSKGSANIMYPYGPSEGDRITPNVDDGAVEVPISTTFTFFNKNYKSLFVNNNGVISFGVAVSKYTPDAFPLADGSAFVAPFWGDVNTLLGGHVYFRESSRPDLLKRVSDDINSYFPNINYKARWAFIATWDKVAYYGSLSHRVNTFQAVLTTDGRLSYIILNFADIQWTTGAASKGNPNTGLGGIPAQAGFNSGDQTHYFNIPGSRTADIINIATTSNVNIPGRWVFRVDNFAVPGGCVAGVNFAKFGDIFWKDDACEQKCKCKTDGETECTSNECSISEVCKPTKWFFVCQAPDSCI